MSGRDLFTFNPDLVNQLGDYDDDDIFDLSGYKQDENEEQEEELEAEQAHHEQSDEVDGENVAENPYEEGCSSSSTSNNKTENTTTTLVTEEGLEVKEDLFAAEDLDDLDEEDEEE